jgi:two-component system, chemotaxis family, CheB/CheR fusion protein
MRARRSALVRYGAALVASELAAALTHLLLPAAQFPPYSIHYAAVLISTWYGGLGPGLVSTLASSLLLHFMLASGAWEDSLQLEMERVGLFTVIAILTSAVTAALRHNETRASEHAARLRVTLSSIADGVIVTDPRGRILSMNPLAQTLTGWRQEDALGRPIEEVFPVLDAKTGEPMQSLLRRALVTGNPIRSHNDRLLLAKSGATIPIDDTASPIRDTAGEFLGAVKVFRDVSEARRASEELEEREAELADFFENAPVGMHWVGPAGIILRANKAELRMLGYSAEEYIGHHIGEFHARPEVIGEILHRLREGQTLREVESTLRCKDGSLREVLISSNVLWRDGEFVHTRSFTRDVTAQKQAERELLQARQAAEAGARAKDRFIAVLSHELRTPLTPVLLGLTDLRQEGGLSEDLLQRVEMMHRNVELEVRLINDLLDLTRIARGKVTLSRETTDVHALVAHVTEICESELREKGLTLTLHLGAQRHLVLGDPARLQQVLWNLLKNAVKYTPPGGAIRVVSRNEAAGPSTNGESGGRLTLEVIDTGIGFEAEALPRLFRAFEQGQSPRQAEGGLGLGLAISTGLVEAHGGVLSASSPGPGMGATFTIELPALHQLAEPRPREPVELDGGIPEAPLRILLVEDHEDTSRVMCHLLRKRHYDVRSAASIGKALEILEQVPVDLLISDIALPDGSGLDLMRQLRERWPIKGIALSGHGTEIDVSRSKAAGFASHLTKPVDFHKLLAEIRELAEPANA